MNYDELKRLIGEVIDPSLGEPLKSVNGIKKLVIEPTGIVHLEINLRNLDKDQDEMKLKLAKIVKAECGFPGIKISFFQSTYVKNVAKELLYIAIASGKGGVGKSNVTANLALALTRLGKTVGIFDADVYGASIPYLFGVQDQELTASQEDEMIPVISHGIEMVSVAFLVPENKPLMWRGPMLGKILGDFLNRVNWQNDIDVMLIDMPPGTGDVAIDLKKYIPEAKVIVVTTPNKAASSIAIKAGLGAKQAGHEILGVLENMSYYHNKCNDQNEYIFGSGGGEQVAFNLSAPLIGQIPISQPIDQSPLFETGEIKDIYDDIANAILSMVEEI